MSAIVDGLLYSWNKNLDYANRLMADVPEQKMLFQPQPRMNHPAWILSHLNVYHDPIAALLLNEPFEDPKGHKFGMGSQPLADVSVYGTKQQLMEAYTKGHERVAAALRKVGGDVLERDTPLERWKPIMPKLGIVLPYLMLIHEATHLGQLSVWRRVQGMPSV